MSLYSFFFYLLQPFLYSCFLALALELLLFSVHLPSLLCTPHFVDGSNVSCHSGLHLAPSVLTCCTACCTRAWSFPSCLSPFLFLGPVLKSQGSGHPYLQCICLLFSGPCSVRWFPVLCVGPPSLIPLFSPLLSHNSLVTGCGGSFSHTPGVCGGHGGHPVPSMPLLHTSMLPLFPLGSVYRLLGC